MWLYKQKIQHPLCHRTGPVAQAASKDRETFERTHLSLSLLKYPIYSFCTTVILPHFPSLTYDHWPFPCLWLALLSTLIFCKSSHPSHVSPPYNWALDAAIGFLNGLNRLFHVLLCWMHSPEVKPSPPLELSSRRQSFVLHLDQVQGRSHLDLHTASDHCIGIHWRAVILRKWISSPSHLGE